MVAAWSTVAEYGLMTALGICFSHRRYPIPFEWGRIGRKAAAAFRLRKATVGLLRYVFEHFIDKQCPKGCSSFGVTRRSHPSLATGRCHKPLFVTPFATKPGETYSWDFMKR